MYAAVSLLLLTICLPSGWMVQQKPLDDYVKQHDSHYSYTLKNTEAGQGFTIYTLNMTSLKWLNDSEVDATVWWHELTIVVPQNPKMMSYCLLMIGNGRNDGVPQPMDLSIDEAIMAAKAARSSCTAVLRQIPNQPVTYHKISKQNCKNSIEDYAVFCSWRKFITHKASQPDVLIQFPMVKATVRAMDTITAFLQEASAGKINIAKFMLTGGSKRGWTTWLTAAVDDRVVSFAPLVFDFLNIIKSWHHQYRAYCGWTFAWRHIHELKITQKLDSPRFKTLTSHVDPFAYNKRYLNKPKYLIIAAGDEFFPLDDSHQFFSKLSGAKYFWATPNNDHLMTTDPPIKLSIAMSALSFYLRTILNWKMPQISWKRTETEDAGIIELYTDTEPSAVKCFFSNTLGSERRDFRLWVGPDPQGVSQPISWLPCNVENVETGVYKAEEEKPQSGWKAFFIEATFPGPGTTDFVLSSEVHIIPDTLPCPACFGKQCQGEVV